MNEVSAANPLRFDLRSQPLVSVICFCKNRASMIGRCIDSVINQSYRNIEFVVQDGASTDGTLEILLDHAKRDSRIKVVSAPDSGPAEAFWNVLQRCNGDYIATCLSDEELALDAVEKAVGWFIAEPNVGAFTCDGFTTDGTGVVTGEFNAGEFDFVAYLFQRYCPFWPGSFFRRQALLDVGLGTSAGWTIGCLEFEIWCRLARDHHVKHVPVAVSKYAVHPGQLSNTPANFYEHIDNRLKLIKDMFADDGFFDLPKAHERAAQINQRYAPYNQIWFREIEAQINHLSQFEFHANAHKLPEHEAVFADRIADLREKLVELHAHNARVAGYAGLNPGLDAAARRKRVTKEVWRACEVLIGISPSVTPAALKARFKLGLLRHATERLFAAKQDPLRATLRFARQLGLDRHSAPEFEEYSAQVNERRKAEMYDITARIYESRGQLTEALAMWRQAESLHDPHIDAHACQQALKNPEATYERLAELQQRWVDRHVRQGSTAWLLPVLSHYDGKRRLKVGYHCSFMDSDTIRYIMRRVIKAHDRTKVEVYGYAPSNLPDDIRSVFDHVLNVAGMSDEKFAERARADGLDVFVELSGFSFGHRFGAMARRCAPVQISYLNHFATSRVANVDYVLSDETCTPLESDEAQKTFTETIYRLPGCLLRYDYADGNSPPVGRLPALNNGFVTFGCFGSANKINLNNISLWAEVMNRVPGSKLLLQHSQFDPPDNRRFIVSRFGRFGIAADRVVVRSGTTRDAILAAYGEMDISFDTWPYCGGNTLAESLWQGVPAITLKGEMMCSRYGASLLQAAGMPELVAHSRREYVDIAVKLAEHTEKLAARRADMRRQYSESGLDDSAGFARLLERAYAHMIEVAARNAPRPRALPQQQ